MNDKHDLEQHALWVSNPECGERLNWAGRDLSDADLLEADLTGADLTGADLSGANLYFADLLEANLSVANLTRANLTGANLTTAAGLAKTNLEEHFSLEKFLQAQQKWSGRVFGGGLFTASITKHIENELTEIRSAPKDLSEWLDVVLLAFDGAWRAGFTPKEIISGLVAKQKINIDRAWPATCVDGMPNEHIRKEGEVSDENQEDQQDA